MSDDVLTRNENEELAVRVVSTTGDTGTNPNDVYTRDNDGNLCVRVTGAGGGDSHNKGYYATPQALAEAYPTAEAGDFAIVESTDTVWIWDSDESEWVDSDRKGQVTSVNGQTGDVTVQETLVSGTNIKTINGNSVLGAGNLELSTYLTYPASWTTNSTTKAFCDDIAADTTAVKGKAYLGEVTLSDLPAGIINSEIVVEIMDGTTAANKVILLTLTSGNVAPYQWQYTYWNNGSSLSGWIETGEQKQADWNQTDNIAKDFIKNKPTIPSTAQQVGAVPQYSTMPTASVSNLGELVQYSGNDIPDVPASATITQTVGSGLTDLAVDVDTFTETEQPTGDETVDFVFNEYNAEPVAIDPDPISWSCSINIDELKAQLIDMGQWDGETYPINVVVQYDGSMFRVGPSVSSSWSSGSAQDMESYGVYIDGSTETGWLQYSIPQTAENHWEKDSEPVTLADYGITFTGTPADGDTLEVDYSALVPGKTKGYFYLNAPTYSEPTATISQTTGSGLTDLAVDLETFVATEQPTQSESVEFIATENSDSVSPTVFTGIGQDSATLSFDSSVFLPAVKSNMTGTDFSQVVKFRVRTYDGVDWDIWASDVGGEVIGSISTTLSDLQTSYGLTIDGTLVVGSFTYFDMYYTQSSIGWTKSGDAVTLADYGITYSGTPANNDVLTVVYTAPVVTGCVWQQINTQPAGEGGGSAGIDWKVKVDLPAEYVGPAYSCTPAWTIAGGLPDGEYEFYFSTKTNNIPEFPIGEVIFKVNIIVDNTNNYVWGRLGYVFDGNYQNDGNNVFGNEDANLWGWFRKNGNDLILYYVGTPFVTNLSNYYRSTLIPECWKMSAFTNVATGQKYIPTGVLDLNGDSPTYTDTINGYGIIQRIVNQPEQREYLFSNNNVSLNSSIDGIVLNCFTNYVSEGIDGTERLDIVLESPLGKYNASFKGLISDYEFIVYEATGVFENTELGYTNAMFGLKFNLPNNTNTTVSYRVAYYGVRGNPSAYLTTGLGTLTGFFEPLKIGSTIRPTIAGKILQYTGVTDANYTNGYFYKANGTIVSAPENATFTTSDSDVAVSINLNDFATAIQNIWGWSANNIKNMLNSNNYWQMDYDVDNSQITRLYWGATGDLQNYPDVMSAFSVTYTGSQTGTISNIDLTSSYTPAHQEVQNPSWDRVDVQPSGGGGNYLPITGGTLEGDLTMGTDPVTSYQKYAINFGNGSCLKADPFNTYTLMLYDGTAGVIKFDAGSGVVCPSVDASYHTLGKSNLRWGNVYTIKINNGADIDVPTTGGTMVVATPPSAAGTYILKATVDSGGNVTYAWVAE